VKLINLELFNSIFIYFFFISNKKTGFGVQFLNLSSLIPFVFLKRKGKRVSYFTWYWKNYWGQLGQERT